MAFSTIQGSGGAPDSFVGTSGVDTISIIDSTGNFFLGAQEANDVVTFISANINDSGVVTGATLKGGQGNDNFTSAAGSGMAVYNGVFFNGNSNADTFAFGAGLLSGSTVQGGQGADNITVSGGAVSSLINGNKDADTITLQTTAVGSSNVFGGQGADTINVNIATTSSVVDGSDDNDFIAVAAATALTGSTLLGGQGNDSINTGAVATLAFEADGGDGNDQVTGTGAADTIRGGAGNDTIAAGAGADLVDGGAGNDNITGAAGADTITLGGGVDTVVQTTGTSVAYTTSTLTAAGAFVAGQVVTFGNQVDVITDFNSTLSIDVTTAGNLTYIASGATATVAGDNYAVRGNWSASAGTFTFNATGGDALVLVDAASATTLTNAANNTANWLVVQGAGGSLAVANFI